MEEILYQRDWNSKKAPDKNSETEELDKWDENTLESSKNKVNHLKTEEKIK